MSLCEEDLAPPPQAVWHLLTDAHCHPTDDPRPWKDVDALVQKLSNVQIGNVCAMSTSTRDQELVSQLADRLPDKITPAFGYHPWFVHLISADSYENPKDHYRALFDGEKDQHDLEDLLPNLPDPIPLHSILATLRGNLERHPKAILGEVGIDRVFRLPNDPQGWTRDPDQLANNHSLALRNRRLTNLYTPLEHQLYIIKKQIAIAIELGRSVSLHSVRAGGATVSLLEDLKKEYPTLEEGLNKKERKQLQKDMQRQSNGTAIADRDIDKKCFQDINVDLHSCTLSAPMISQLQQKHPNLYVSFSIAINARQKNLQDQIKACDPKRLLVESDWHSAEDLGARCWQLIRLATDVLGDRLVDMQTEKEERYIQAAKVFHENWMRFVGDASRQ